jgi:transcriptional regulator with XRE-family HTH domain
MDSASLPFYHLTISASHPRKPGYPASLVTIGDHIRKRRLDLGLFQRQVAAQIGVDEASVLNWEKGGMKPEIRHLPAIIRFLGYNPLPEPDALKARLVWARSSRGLSRVACARLLGVDPLTMARWETGRGKLSDRHLETLQKLFKAGS